MKKIMICMLLLIFLTEKSYAIELSAVSACVINSETEEIIYEKNAYERMPMASTTKIMTAILALEKSNIDDVVTASKNAERTEGSSIYLKAGDKIKMGDLLYGLMLESGNDAAVAVAEYVSGNIEAFAGEMTALAQKIGASNTQFKNPNGLDEEGHYTTAYDLAKISAYAMKNPDFREIVSQTRKNVVVNTSEILYFKNHNKLLGMYEGTVGIKTGYTKKCGRCLVSAAEKGGNCLIAVTLNSPDDWNDHIKLLDFGFENCKNKVILKNGEKIRNFYTEDKCELGILAKDEIKIFYKDNPGISIRLHMREKIKTPIRKGEALGIAEIFANGKKYAQTDVVSDRTVEKTNGFLKELERCVKKYAKMYLRL